MKKQWVLSYLHFYLHPSSVNTPTSYRSLPHVNVFCFALWPTDWTKVICVTMGLKQFNEHRWIHGWVHNERQWGSVVHNLSVITGSAGTGEQVSPWRTHDLCWKAWFSASPGLLPLAHLSNGVSHPFSSFSSYLLLPFSMILTES